MKHSEKPLLQRASLAFCRLQMEGFTALAIAKRSAFGFVCGSSTKTTSKVFVTYKFGRPVYVEYV